MVDRPDLSKRLTLSKSALVKFGMCPSKTWQAKHYPRPFIKTPRVTFGSCVDASVEILAACARAGLDLDFDRALAASWEVQNRDGVEVDQEEVELATRRFASDVMPRFDWAFCRTQAHIRLPLFDWGEVDGHPDLIFSSHSVWDVKTSTKPKQTALTVELGMYALMVAEDTGRHVPEVGYLCWVRGETKFWQGFGPDEIGERELKTGARKGQKVPTGHYIPSTYVDDDFLRWTREQVSAYVRADRTDDLMNRKLLELGREPVNYSSPGGPINVSMCRDCEYAPFLGGNCKTAPAYRGDNDGDRGDGNG